jgi:hypothetical protein
MTPSRTTYVHETRTTRHAPTTAIPDTDAILARYVQQVREMDPIALRTQVARVNAALLARSDTAPTHTLRHGHYAR